jgi:hypothetical protein
MSDPQKSSRTKLILIIAVTLVAAVAVGAILLRGHVAHVSDSRSAANPVPATLSGPGPAAQVRVVSESATSVQLALTLPDNESVEETITIQPGRRYTPTPAELAEAARTGRQTFAVKFSSAPEGTAGTRLTLEYFVPYSAFPEVLRRRVLGPPATTSHFEIVSSAWAEDEGGLGAGVSTAADFHEGYENIESALDKSQEHSDWMAQLDALINCARNPTSALTQSAFRQDPQYQQRTIDAIEQARSEVKQATAMRFLNQETSVASGLVEGPLGQVVGLTGAVSDWNESTLRYIANQQIMDVSKLISCDLAPPPPKQKQGDGTITYHMHREGYLDYDEEDRINKGTFDLKPGPVAGAVSLTGEGEFKGRMSASKVGTKGQCKGTSEIHGGGYSGDLEISGSPVGGQCLFDDHGKVTELSPTDSDTAFSCTFHNVDVVNGGKYEVHADGEESPWATCALELKPRQK